MLQAGVKHKAFYYLGCQNDVIDRYDLNPHEIELVKFSAGEINHVINNSSDSVLLSLDAAISDRVNISKAMRSLRLLLYHFEAPECGCQKPLSNA